MIFGPKHSLLLYLNMGELIFNNPSGFSMQFPTINICYLLLLKPCCAKLLYLNVVTNYKYTE